MTMSWKQAMARYQEPMLRKSIWQVINSLIPYLSLCGLMIWTLHISYWLTLALAVPAAGFMIRVFIIFHDCGHGSFFKSQRANHVLGFITGVLTFTPYHQWRHKHALHHATSGDLDAHGAGVRRRAPLEAHRVPLLPQSIRPVRRPADVPVPDSSKDSIAQRR